MICEKIDIIIVKTLCNVNYLIHRLCKYTKYKNHLLSFHSENFTVWFVEYFKLYDVELYKKDA